MRNERYIETNVIRGIPIVSDAPADGSVLVYEASKRRFAFGRAVVRYETELVTGGQEVVALTHVVPDNSRTKLRAFVVMSSFNDPADSAWFELRALALRNNPNAVVVNATASTSGNSGGGSNASASIVASTTVSNVVELRVSGANLGVGDYNWKVVLEVETVQATPLEGYRTILRNGPTLSSALTTNQKMRSASRGSTYRARYFRLSVPVGTSLTIDQVATGAGWDGYCYLTKGTTRGGTVVAFDHDGGGSLNPRIVYTTQPADGTEFVIECTPFSDTTTGTFTLQVT